MIANEREKARLNRIQEGDKREEQRKLKLLKLLQSVIDKQKRNE